MNRKVCVIGSINIDLVVNTDCIPRQGETIIGNDFFIKPGGKGANQAVAASKMDVDINMIGAVGSDEFGKISKENLSNHGINTSAISELDDVPTGVANIILSNKDNRIIVIQGANEKISKEMIQKHLSTIIESNIILLQLEIPIEVIEAVVEIAYKHHIKVVLNPAPYQKLNENICKKLTYITPNENELESLQKSEEYELLRNKIIVTMGSKGVRIHNKEIKTQLKSHTVDVVDTTGAGDTFNGVFAAMLAKGKGLLESVTIANGAAALSITKLGAQEGMPTIEALETYLEKATKKQFNLY